MKEKDFRKTDIIEQTDGAWRDGEWSINYSSILTYLIKRVGQLTEHYASDLFISWQFVEKELKKREPQANHLIGIREMGVDGNTYVLSRYNDPIMYRPEETYIELYLLDIETNKDKIKMTLYKLDKSVKRGDQEC